MAIIKQLKEYFTKQNVYPITVTNAVFDTDGNRLSEYLNGNLITSDDVLEEIEATVPIVADRIGSYTAEQIGDVVDSFPIYQTVMKKFQPSYFYSLQEILGTQSSIKNIIDIISTVNIDGYIIPVYLDYSDGTMSERISRDILTFAINYIESIGKKVWAIKIHNSTYENTTEFKSAYRESVLDIANTYANKIDNFIILNECTLCYEDDIDWINSLLIDLNKVVPTSISWSLKGMMGHNVDSIISNCKHICFNYYPSMGVKDASTTLEDCVSAWNDSFIKSCISSYKHKFPNKCVYITETGVRDYFEAFRNPEFWDTDFSSKTPTDGIAQQMYTEAAFISLNNNIDGIASWYSINYQRVINMLIKYTGGDYR